MTDRMPLVIRSLPGVTRFYVRARLTDRYVDAGDLEIDEALTDIGKTLRAQLLMVDGVDLTKFDRHYVDMRLVHPALWSWDEVEPASNPGVCRRTDAAVGLDVRDHPRGEGVVTDPASPDIRVAPKDLTGMARRSTPVPSG